LTESAPVLLQEPTFPPLLTGRRLLEDLPVRAAAARDAAANVLGAGDVLWSDDPLRVEIAIVLEPEVPLTRAIQILPLTMCATGDCIGAMAPPQVGSTFLWPGTIQVNGAAVGEVTLDVAACADDEVPDWMVAGVSLRFRHPEDAAEPGQLGADMTALAEEGCGELTTYEIIESCSRHFLTWLNIWQNEGFEPVHQSWLARAAGRDEVLSIRHAGASFADVKVRGLDDEGNLLIQGESSPLSALALMDAITLHRD
jgi:BirA family biotin operon repressor/biotin-[acetyl-CoA-carboxylase] ligase